VVVGFRWSETDDAGILLIEMWNQLLRIEEELGQSAEFIGIESVNYGE